MDQEHGTAGDDPIASGAGAGNILVVDQDIGTAQTVAAILRNEGYTVLVAPTLDAAQATLSGAPVDVALAELSAESVTSGEPLSSLHSVAPGATVLVLAGFASLDTALGALRAGAYDYLVKPVDVDQLRRAVSRAAERRRLERELAARVRELEAAHAEVQVFNEHLQQQVQQATAELRAKVAELDAANQQLRETQEQHDRFVAMVAHEMRGPLNPIINYATLAKRPGLPTANLERYMDVIVEHAYRLNRLVGDLQTATRLSTGQFSLRREACDIAGAVREVVEQFVASVPERHFTLEGADESLVAEVDRDRVVQALRNLIDNAVKYSVEQGAIEVSLAKDEGYLHITVGDYGAGIPDAEMQHIFDAFTRLQQRGDVAGTGLGLYITRGIVAAHGGSLLVRNRSSEGRAQGALFTITLPLRTSVATPADD